MKKLNKKFITGLIIVLLAVPAYAYYTSPTATAPDIAPGDIVSDLPDMTGVPTSGTWSFKLDIGNPGAATIYSSPDGAYVVLDADGQSVFLYRTSSIVPYTYTSNPRSFDLRGEGDAIVTGHVYFEFTAVSSSVIDGTMRHDITMNGQIQPGGAERKFHMELINPELPTNPWYQLISGNWNIQYSEPESDCEDGVASFPSLNTNMEIEAVYDLDTGEPSGEVVMTNENESIFFTPGDNNAYAQSGGPIDAGLPVDISGDIIMDAETNTYSASYDFFSFDENSIEGTVTITSSDGCGYSMSFSGSSSSVPTS